MEVVAAIINGNNAKYENFYNTGDAAGVASLHTKDTVVMPPNLDFILEKKPSKQRLLPKLKWVQAG